MFSAIKHLRGLRSPQLRPGKYVTRVRIYRPSPTCCACADNGHCAAGWFLITNTYQIADKCITANTCDQALRV